MADEGFRSMQQEAMDRVREMQRRSQSYIEPSAPPKDTEEEKSRSEPALEDKTLFNVGGIKIDEEKALIALLIYILYKNKADMKLLLGLGYLLL